MIASRFRRIALTALLLVAPVAARAEENARYVAPGGAFSVATKDVFYWKPGPADVADGRIIVDFTPLTVGIALIMRRSVEWIAIAKPLDPAEFDFQAKAVVAGYLQGRFGDALTVAGQGKSRDAAGRLVYAFAAKGTVGGMPAYWQGTVLIFDTAVALASELIAQPTQHKFAPEAGVIWPEAVAWARDLRPGP